MFLPAAMSLHGNSQSQGSRMQLLFVTILHYRIFPLISNFSKLTEIRYYWNCLAPVSSILWELPVFTDWFTLLLRNIKYQETWTFYQENCLCGFVLFINEKNKWGCQLKKYNADGSIVCFSLSVLLHTTLRLLLGLGCHFGGLADGNVWIVMQPMTEKRVPMPVINQDDFKSDMVHITLPFYLTYCYVVPLKLKISGKKTEPPTVSLITVCSSSYTVLYLKSY